MGIPKTDSEAPGKPRKSRLRGSALEGSDQKSAPDHMDYEKGRSPDSELRLDGEDESLYNDGLDLEIDEEDDTPAGTRGTSSGIKP
jgi:hypothetical protein